jgi:ATP-dependent protease ClpP protease subunit
VERIRDDMQTDHFMNAEDALDYGLVDVVVQPAAISGPLTKRDGSG